MTIRHTQKNTQKNKRIKIRQIDNKNTKLKESSTLNRKVKRKKQTVHFELQCMCVTGMIIIPFWQKRKYIETDKLPNKEEDNDDNLIPSECHLISDRQQFPKNDDNKKKSSQISERQIKHVSANWIWYLLFVAKWGEKWHRTKTVTHLTSK